MSDNISSRLRKRRQSSEKTSHGDSRVPTNEVDYPTDSSIANINAKQQEEIKKLKTDQEDLNEFVFGEEKETVKITSSEKYGQRNRNCRLSLADLGGGVRDARPPLGVQILSISCSFRENLACSRPPWRVHAPPSGKSWIRHWLLSKLLNDTKDQSSHQAKEEKSEATGGSESQRNNLCNQVLCGQSPTRKQLPDPSRVVLEKKGVSDDHLQNKETMETNLRCDQRSTEEKNDVDNYKTYAISMEDREHNKDGINVVIKRNNPYLVKLITQEDTIPYGEEPNQGSAHHSEDDCKHFTSDVVKEEVFGGKSENFKHGGECQAESINSTVEPELSHKSGSRKGDSDNDVDGDETTETRDRYKKVQTKKTSIRLRRRSGESWAIRYEKDFVLTPLAKLSKDDATFLPSKGTDATIVSEENLLKEVRSRNESSFVAGELHGGNFASSSTSSVVRKPKVQYKRRKNKRKYSPRYGTNKNFASKRQVTWTLPFEATGIYCDQ